MIAEAEVEKQICSGFPFLYWNWGDDLHFFNATFLQAEEINIFKICDQKIKILMMLTYNRQ